MCFSLFVFVVVVAYPRGDEATCSATQAEATRRPNAQSLTSHNALYVVSVQGRGVPVCAASCLYVKLYLRDERTNGRTDGLTKRRLCPKCVCQGRPSYGGNELPALYKFKGGSDKNPGSTKNTRNLFSWLSGK